MQSNIAHYLIIHLIILSEDKDETKRNEQMVYRAFGTLKQKKKQTK